jgi:hypothetical protein
MHTIWMRSWLTSGVRRLFQLEALEDRGIPAYLLQRVL